MISMSCFRSKASLFLLTIIFIISTFFFSNGFSQTSNPQSVILHQGKSYENGRVERLLQSSDPSVGVEANGSIVNNSTLILAKKRTYRKDPLNHFDKYTGGWNISEQHYWASVGFTAVPMFVVAVIWFVVFGLSLGLICCCYCCCPREPYGYSRTAYALSLILLILFTITAIIGCIVLYTSQEKFHDSTTDTLNYVVQQADLTAENLRNVSDYLDSAQKITVAKVLLPPDMQTKIDDVQKKMTSSATNLSQRTDENKKQIHTVLDIVRLILIILASVMILLAFIGFICSIFGLKFIVSILVVIGWILVTGTFVLCGVFLLLHNVVADSCVAMDEWVQHPTAYTALDDILPCVDSATANETLQQTKEASRQLVNVVNQVITNISNNNFSSSFPTVYYNQSGPSIPILCDPFNNDWTDRQCSTDEVNFNNATQVWKNYVCQVSSAGICTTMGRLTPEFYTEMSAAVNVSFALYHYGPVLVNLQDCTFVRVTFSKIESDYCPGLIRNSKWTYVGLVMVSVAVMLSLIFWVIYARERRHRVYTKHFNHESGQGSYGNKNA